MVVAERSQTSTNVEGSRRIARWRNGCKSGREKANNNVARKMRAVIRDRWKKDQ